MTVEIVLFVGAWFCAGMAVIAWTFPDGLRGACREVLPARDARMTPALWAAVMAPVVILAVATWPLLVWDLLRGAEPRRERGGPQ